MEKYEGFIEFLKIRKKLGGKLTLVKELGKLYAEDKHPSGMVFQWYYDRDADADYIATKVGIPVEEKGVIQC
jgi:hypothetical protein